MVSKHFNECSDLLFLAQHSRSWFHYNNELMRHCQTLAVTRTLWKLISQYFLVYEGRFRLYTHTLLRLVVIYSLRGLTIFENSWLDQQTLMPASENSLNFAGSFLSNSYLETKNKRRNKNRKPWLYIMK